MTKSTIRRQFDSLVNLYRLAQRTALRTPPDSLERKHAKQIRAYIAAIELIELRSPVFPPINLLADYPPRCPACRALAHQHTTTAGQRRMLCFFCGWSCLEIACSQHRDDDCACGRSCVTSNAEHAPSEGW